MNIKEEEEKRKEREGEREKKRETGKGGKRRRRQKITSGSFCWLLLPKKKYKKIIAQRSTHTRSGILGENTAVKGGG